MSTQPAWARGRQKSSEKPQLHHTDLKPIRWAVIGSLSILILMVVVGASIGGSYLLSLQAIHQIAVNNAALHARELQSSVRSSIPTCRALLTMDNASHGAIFPHYPGNHNQGYGVRLASAIHQLYSTSKCSVILSGKPIPVIVKELTHHG